MVRPNPERPEIGVLHSILQPSPLCEEQMSVMAELALFKHGGKDSCTRQQIATNSTCVGQREGTLKAHKPGARTWPCDTFPGMCFEDAEKRLAD